MPENNLALTSDEKVWLDAYKCAIRERFPGLIEDLIVFGSKARGTATEDSDLDMVVIIREGDWRVKQAVSDAGYALAIGTQVVPSLVVFTKDEWDLRMKEESPFWQTIYRDGVTVV